MTTVAYKDGVIAADGRACAGSTIVDDDCDKIKKVNGVVFAMCGCPKDFGDMFSAYFGEPHAKDPDVSAIIDDGGELFVASFEEGEFWKCPLTEPVYALGSGTDHALTAMDLGCSAKEAVKLAMKRDCKTGGKIRTHKCKAQKV